ncbi:hypothetical protein IAG41_16120 [Sphingomonas sp. JC676]|uniref:helix-turn-helix transcriptional regulator n=1 Tax=Sphingomonas sp. JC676 TaxID=2768065 RepID=UPI001657AE9B|nr:hypothetical protein [Sphingomonas sp. JC676]MBC9033919.1 hypothetical protein [Sphingomonas sp. JC676]
MAFGSPGGVLPVARSLDAEVPAFRDSQICATSAGYDPELDSALSIFRESVDADATLITWQGDAGDHAVLCSSGSAADYAFLAREEQTVEVDWRTGKRAGRRWDAMTSSVSIAGGRVSISAFFRDLDADARLQVRESVQLLTPLLETIIALWVKRQQVTLRLGAMTHAVDDSGLGVILLDHRGHVLFANAIAERLIDAHDGIRRSCGSIAAVHLGDSARLHAAIDHVIAPTACDLDRGDSIPVIALRRANRERPLMVALVPHRIQASPGDRDRAAAIVYLFDPGQDLRRRLEPACHLYGLSPVETRLASLLAGGVSLTEAADSLRIREQTARSYLKQIFGKTDTSRQAQLVSLLLRSCVHAAPGCNLDIL